MAVSISYIANFWLYVRSLGRVLRYQVQALTVECDIGTWYFTEVGSYFSLINSAVVVAYGICVCIYVGKEYYKL